MNNITISTERRNATRVNYDLWVKEITDESERIIRCINLSSSGMKFLGKPITNKSKLLIRFGRNIYSVKAEVVRTEDDAFAVRFINPPLEIISLFESLSS